MQPNHPHPGKSVVDVASRRTYTAHRAGGELTTRGLEPAKSRAGPGAYDRRAQGCKIHGSEVKSEYVSESRAMEGKFGGCGAAAPRNFF